MKFSRHSGDIFRDPILNVQALGGDDSLHVMPEAAAGIQDAISGVGVPDLRDHGLEGVQIWVRSSNDPLDDAPPKIIERLRSGEDGGQMSAAQKARTQQSVRPGTSEPSWPCAPALRPDGTHSCSGGTSSSTMARPCSPGSCSTHLRCTFRPWQRRQGASSSRCSPECPAPSPAVGALWCRQTPRRPYPRPVSSRSSCCGTGPQWRSSRQRRSALWMLGSASSTLPISWLWPAATVLPPQRWAVASSGQRTRSPARPCTSCWCSRTSPTPWHAATVTSLGSPRSSPTGSWGRCGWTPGGGCQNQASSRGLCWPFWWRQCAGQCRSPPWQPLPLLPGAIRCQGGQTSWFSWPPAPSYHSWSWWFKCQNVAKHQYFCLQSSRNSSGDR